MRQRIDELPKAPKIKRQRLTANIALISLYSNVHTDHETELGLHRIFPKGNEIMLLQFYSEQIINGNYGKQIDIKRVEIPVTNFFR